MSEQVSYDIKLKNDVLLKKVEELEQQKKEGQNEIKKYRLLFENMMNGFALHEMVFNDAGAPVDYIFLDINTAFENTTGLKKQEILGKRVTQVLPGIENDPADWIGRYGQVAVTGREIRFEQYSRDIDKWFSVLAYCPKKGQFAVIFEDITDRKQSETSLKAIEWLLKKRPVKSPATGQEYGELTRLNTQGLILTSVGKEVISDIVSGYLELLETSSAVYEKNGDYAHGIYSSGYCRLLHIASRRLCDPLDDKEALSCGKWLCHESCWRDASINAIESGNPTDIECSGGMRIFAVPIKARDQVIGAINFGYGDPPKDRSRLKAIAEAYQVDLDDLIRESEQYESRPPFIIEIAKKRLMGSANLIGVMVESKQAQKELQKEREQLKVTLQSIGDGVITTDRNGRVVMVNHVAQQLTGWSQKEGMGRQLPEIFEIINEQTQKMCENPVAQVLKTNRQVELANHTVLICRDGTRRVIADSAAPIVDTDGQTIGVVLVFRDMTHTASLEKALRQAHKMEAVGNLAGGIAHEFNNVLGIIIGNIDLAIEDLEKEHPVSENLVEVKKAGHRAKEVVKQLLSFSRKMDIRPEPVDLKILIKETIKLLKASIPSNIRIQQDFPEMIPAIIADVTQIHQLVINLCSNAAQAMSEQGGVLTIALQSVRMENDGGIPDLTAGHYVRLTIRDTGHGIAEDIKDKIFDPYFTTKAIGKGTGMGLAVVHGIVKTHHGAIKVNSDVGKGTVFDVYFPSTTQRISGEHETRENLPRGRESILFVDDEQSIVSIFTRILTHLGYKVSGFTDPVTLLETFQAGPDQYDLIISDMTMPGLTGDRLAEQIFEIRPDMPVIVCTGFSERIAARTLQQAGIKKVLAKPIETRELAQSIRTALDHP